jgi:AcrR family transcriptional regulator
MSAVVAVDETQRRLQAVRRPRPVLGRQREQELTDRQRQILEQLVELVADGFAELTMADLAARLSCSLRTLYALAPSRDELVLVAIDGSLWRIGRVARDAIGEDLAPLDAIRAYLEAATVAVSGWTEGFARDLGAVPAALHLQDEHNEYLFEVTRTLLDLAVERGDIAQVDTAAVARVLAGLGRFFSRPAVIPTLRSSPKEAADEVVELIIRGLRHAAQEAAQ